MARHKVDPASPPDLATLAGRIAWLLIHLFGGNMRRMAEAVGLSHCLRPVKWTPLSRPRNGDPSLLFRQALVAPTSR